MSGIDGKGILGTLKDGNQLLEAASKYGQAMLGNYMATISNVEKGTNILGMVIYLFLILGFLYFLFSILLSFLLGDYLMVGFKVFVLILYKKYIIEKYNKYVKEKASEDISNAK